MRVMGSNLPHMPHLAKPWYSAINPVSPQFPSIYNDTVTGQELPDFLFPAFPKPVLQSLISTTGIRNTCSSSIPPSTLTKVTRAACSHQLKKRKDVCQFGCLSS